MPRLNKPAQEGYRYRSPGQTNAEDVMPHPREDVVASQRADADRIRRGANSQRVANAANRARSQEAAARALLRTGARSAGASGALMAGYDAGRALDEATGVGRAMVDRGIGKAVDQVAAPAKDRVKLTPEARRRIDSGEPETSGQRVEVEGKRLKPPARAEADEPTYASGIDDDVRARARKFVKDSEEVGFAKGGAVRGWGKARGAKSCKMR